jgi:hypothetical protein
VKCLSSFKSAATRAQRFLRRFLDKPVTITPELFENYISAKVTSLYLQMQLTQEILIDALPRERPNKYIKQ